ncbi:type I restriction enzyme, S subunit [Chryseobacterium taichungense]|uniref:Type I restriction enzyme, S subunit n=1 Tax=Chryseobacterium taichungense TaxID=295069 RepID=A0A1H7X2R8_9FLAO|nr:restriction endonuclease subunit S [Chryseobacterium taichungense]SEM27895.1 type I restriction enzyme, S subunit [Chryseobacterium taichungense]
MTEENKSVKNFPNSRNIPKLRFLKFNDGWEDKKLGDLMNFKVTNSYSRDNLNYESGTVKNIHYGDIHTKFQTLFDLEKENVPYINEDISLNRISEDFYCQEGDVIFADASEDLNDVGKSIEIINVNGEKLLSGLHTLLARPQKNNFSKGFLGYLLKSDYVRNQIKRESQGSKVLSINVGRISNIHLVYPSIPEQQKISEFLSLLDKRILYSMKIIEDLIILKSSTAQNIFNQVFRFKDSEDNDFPKWDIKKLGDVCEIKRGASPRPISESKWFDEDSKIGWVRISDVTKSNKYLEKTEQYLSNAGISKSRLVKKGNMIMSICATIGKPIYTNFDVCIHDGFVVFENLTLDKEFLYYYLDFIQLNWYKYGQPGIQINLNSEIVNNESVLVPVIEEQIKIAEFLSKFDEKINLENELLTQYENQKKYLLQNLFV